MSPIRCTYARFMNRSRIKEHEDDKEKDGWTLLMKTAKILAYGGNRGED